MPEMYAIFEMLKTKAIAKAKNFRLCHQRDKKSNCNLP